MKRFLFPVLAALALTLGSCEKNECDCKQPLTAEVLTQAATWYLSEYSVGDQTERGSAIKDRFALRFGSDGSYRRILLSDNSETAGTWSINSATRQLFFIDHRGDPQEYSVAERNTSPESLWLSRAAKTGPQEYFLFKQVP
ncbi:hypothetical protein [Hymenobacter psychrophilus]|uniref:Lipocalin-like domain-containing protein n=1 Tax=Hymenobacter psychrophilus TaxID=651662 RepID=A0A1H3GQS6_9BACT|nr:hypothetical protein [Hymenobacter psychrophilus]SDY05400.1 hypothetical protein SAMN04488069_105124 [Hymenobacter psychrophilus]